MCRLILVVCFISIISLGMTRGELLMVSIVLRHGHRSPLMPYPTSPNAKFNWNVESGELTEFGKSQIFTQGTRMRRHYRFLLHKNGTPVFEKALIRSSFLNRAVKSAELFSAGFFHTNDTVPVIAIPYAEDNLILQHVSVHCPNYEEARRALKMSPPKEQLELMQTNSKVLKLLSDRSGVHLAAVKDVAELVDAVICEKDFKLPLPDWADEVLSEPLQEIAAMNLALFSWTEEMKKIMAGPVIADLTNNMLERLKQPREGSIAKNIYIYSGHDLTISTITRSLNLDSQIPKMIRTSSGLVFELHSYDGVPMVQIRWFEPNGRSKVLELENEGPQCQLNRFQDIVKPYLIDNIG